MTELATTSATRGPTAELVRSFDLARLSQAFLDDPYLTYRALREHAPVHKLPDGSIFLTRYDDLAQVYHDSATWSSDKKVDFRPNLADSLLYEHHTTSLVFNDPPIHTRVRKLLAPAFTPRALKALEPRIETLVDRLLDDAARRGTVDVIDDFAAAIPLQLIGDLLGMPPEERGPLRRWSLAILGALEPRLTPQQFETGVEAVAEFKAYLAGLIARRRDQGSDDGREILSTLINASEFAPNANASDERLSELELIHNCIFLLNAGHETTTNLIGNGVDLLLRHPDAMQDLAHDPELIDTAIEEFLRMESSNQLGNRRATRDTVLNGVTIPAKTYVHLCIGAANRDPAQFSQPDRLDIRRSPNRHLAFGLGIHACAGMSLARMEARVAISKLVARFPTIRRAGEPVRSGRARFRGFLHLPVAMQ
ncbi:MAG: cytochrome P450 [Xanthobacteraceae bacterium]|nr:cytochrome P450 [Xanthobacteraceae bacterium]